MHPRNKYSKNPTDFGKLGEKYPEFGKYLLAKSSGGYTINFKDPKAVRELTVSLLQHDFGLKVELPLDRLIPTVTLRLNYIHWIEDLLEMLTDKPLSKTCGIDVGTGASCIYPLLGAKINDWKFLASEVDELSYKFACDNVRRNHLEKNINVRLVNPDIVLAELLTKDDHYDFTMCNPPFFADKSEIIGDHSRTKNRPQPSSVCTGTESETVTTGGEVVFVGKMIDDSLRLGTRVKWYTTMLGKKTSLTSVLDKLKQHNISNFITTEFCQGRTMRWGVAWTFLSDVIVTKCLPKKKRKNKPLQFSFFPDSVCSNETLSKVENIHTLISVTVERFKEILHQLQIRILSENTKTTGEVTTIKLHCNATQHTWANQRRKRREAAGRMRTSDQPVPHHTSSVERCEEALVKSHQNTKGSELDRAETLSLDQKEIFSQHQETSSDNLNSSVVLPNESLGSKLIPVGEDLKNVSCPSDMRELLARPTIRNPVIPVDEISENNEAIEPDKKKIKLPTDTKETKFDTDDKKRKEPVCLDDHDHKHKMLKTDNDNVFFLEFLITLTSKHVDVISHGFSEIFLQMEWIEGRDRNNMYQLFQYFQNRFKN